jgi:hypothetical protein
MFWIRRQMWYCIAAYVVLSSEFLFLSILVSLGKDLVMKLEIRNLLSSDFHAAAKQLK